MTTEELDFCLNFFASMRENSTAHLKKKKTALFSSILAAILSSLAHTISALISATQDRVYIVFGSEVALVFLWLSNQIKFRW